VGDSPQRDLAPARALGIRAVWARYGSRNADREPLLQSVVPFEPPEARHRQDGAAADFEAVDSFAELVDLLGLRQLRFPLEDA